jgi:uncharacterized membrane protein
MTLLVAGLLIFLGVHSTRALSDGLRSRMVAKLGLVPWKAVYALLSVVGFVLIVQGWSAAKAETTLLYATPMWTRHLSALLVLPAFILLAAAYVPGTRIRARVGHPMLLGTKFWAASHLVANGLLHEVLVFSGFFAWAVFAYIAARRRDRRDGVVRVTGPISRDIAAVVIGLIAYAVFAFWAHGVLFGVAPFARATG